MNNHVIQCLRQNMSPLSVTLFVLTLCTVKARPSKHVGSKNVNKFKKVFASTKPSHKRNDVIRKNDFSHQWGRLGESCMKELKLLNSGIQERSSFVLQNVSSKEEAIRGQLYGGTDVNTGYGVGLSGAALGVLNMLPYVHAFDTETGMPYVCDPDKKKPDEKTDNRWNMKVPPCPDFKKCLFPWKEAKDCKTKVDNNAAPSSKRRWVVKPFLLPVFIPIRQTRN